MSNIASNNYAPVRVVDPDAPGRPNAASIDAVEELPPTYDESNRLNPGNAVR